MAKLRFIVGCIFAAAIVLPVHATPAQYPITAGQVSSALAQQGIVADPPRVTLPGVILSTSANPKLLAKSTQKLADGSIVVRVECEDAGVCLPFYAKFLLGRHGEEAVAPVATEQPLRGFGVAGTRKAPVVRPGATVTLLLGGEHMQIRLPVLCLESGAIGDRVRVRALGNHQIFTAKVEDGLVLKGDL